MLRFPNPGSTIQNFIAVYTSAYSELNDKVIDLDDIVSVVVAANLATSSGYMGQEAISRSTRSDRSRDPLYNQLKMYAEIFRSLGWLHPTEERSLNYTFTLLGKQIVASGRYWLPLFRESVLGIVYPSNILEVKGEYNLRPFALILRCMQRLGGVISRDEMIVGPLSASSDRTENDVATILETVHEVRKSSTHIQNALENLSERRRIQINTLKNYTRWPIAVLRDVNWVVDGSANYEDGRSYSVFKLTEEGETIAKALETAADIRLEHIGSLAERQKRAISIHGHYSMLERAGFDLSSVDKLLKETQPDLTQSLVKLGFEPTSRLLFSPFQTLSLSDINVIFPSEELQERSSSRSMRQEGSVRTGRNSRGHLFVEPLFTVRPKADVSEEAEYSKKQLVDLFKKHGEVNEAVAEFVSGHRWDTKERFYPLVTHLFQIVGYASENSRPGVNYQRWDASVVIGDAAIPVEIKSPTEELVLSMKSIRQALENKVISLSRGGIDKKADITSLIVGFDLPQERSDMANLIDDIYKAYGFKIGVISIYSLATLAMAAILKGEMIAPKQLSTLRGFLSV